MYDSKRRLDYNKYDAELYICINEVKFNKLNSFKSTKAFLSQRNDKNHTSRPHPICGGQRTGRPRFDLQVFGTPPHFYEDTYCNKR